MVMNKFLVSLVCLLATAFVATAENPKPFKFVDAEDLRVINRAWKGQHLYHRLPDNIQDSIRPGLADRAKCSAGMGVRFATNSSRIGARYQLLWNFHMNHMADSGIKGADLYVFEGDSMWRHVNTIRPVLADKEKFIIDTVILSNADTTRMSEYMIYFPLYDGVEKFEVKVDSTAAITSGRPDLIDSRRRIVAYGTSIMQGGCASRPGMASSNIISRELNAEVMNLGFSGEGKMDYVVARAMAQIPDVDMYILDPVPNCTEMMCDTLTYDFVNIIRRARPDVPIVMVEGPIFPFARYDSFWRNYLPAKNRYFHNGFERLKADNPNNIYYLDSVEMDGPEDDGTVDGIHYTDLGFRHYADKILPLLRQIQLKD